MLVLSFSYYKHLRQWYFSKGLGLLRSLLHCKSFSDTQTLFLPCNSSISEAAAVYCIVEFNQTIGTLNIVKLSKTWVLCAGLAGPLFV